MIKRINFFLISSEINQLDYLYDTLLVETIYNKTLPEWTKVNIEQTFEECSMLISCTMDITFFYQSCGLSIIKRCGLSLRMISQGSTINWCVRQFQRKSQCQGMFVTTVMLEENHKLGEG